MKDEILDFLDKEDREIEREGAYLTGRHFEVTRFRQFVSSIKDGKPASEAAPPTTYEPFREALPQKVSRAVILKDVPPIFRSTTEQVYDFLRKMGEPMTAEAIIAGLREAGKDIAPRIVKQVLADAVRRNIIAMDDLERYFVP